MTAPCRVLQILGGGGADAFLALRTGRAQILYSGCARPNAGADLWTK